MAGTNKLIKYAILENDITNYDTIPDDDLITLTGGSLNGIQFGAVARSNILNGLFRQLTKTNKVFGDLIVNNYGSDITVQTSNSDAVYEGYIKKTIENISKGVAVTQAATTFTGTRSGVTVNAQGLVTNIVALAYTDLPSVAQNTFLGRTAAEVGVVSAITGANVLTAIGAVPTTRTLAGLDLTANRSRDSLLGISTGTGYVKRTDADTYSITALAYSDLPNISQFTFLGRTASGAGAPSGIVRDNLLGVSTAGFVKRTSTANTYTIDNNTYAVASTVALKDTTTYLGVSQQSLTPKFWFGIQSDYNIILGNNAILSDVIYIII